MSLAIKVASVFGISMLELWAAIPAGSAMRLHPLVTFMSSVTGALLGALIVVSVGKPARDWLLRRHGAKTSEGRTGLVWRVWDRYGVMGLGLVAPVVTGAPLGAAIGVTLGAPVGRLIVWMALGIAFWSIVLTLAAEAGLAWLKGPGL